jgi:hypothetical protein
MKGRNAGMTMGIKHFIESSFELTNQYFVFPVTYLNHETSTALINVEEFIKGSLIRIRMNRIYKLFVERFSHLKSSKLLERDPWPGINLTTID